MIEGEEDRIIRNILLDAAEMEFAKELSDDTVIIPSTRFIRQMHKMTENPTRWAKKYAHLRWNRIKNIAASIFLICTVSFGALVVFNPAARAAVMKWFMEWYETSIIYHFGGVPDFSEFPLYQIADLPTGYERIGYPIEEANSVEIIYKNETGDTIYFEYMRIEDGSAMIIDTTDMELFEVTINGHQSQLYISNNPQQSNCITWYDDNLGIQFSIDGFFDEQELQKMAASVIQSK